MDDDRKRWMLTWMLYFRHIWINVSCVLFHTVDTLTLTSLTCCRFDLAWNIYPWCKIAKKCHSPPSQSYKESHVENLAIIKPNPNPTPPILILKEHPWTKTYSLWDPDTLAPRHFGPMRGCAASCRWICHKIFTPDPNFKPCNVQTKPHFYPTHFDTKRTTLNQNQLTIRLDCYNTHPWTKFASI